MKHRIFPPLALAATLWLAPLAAAQESGADVASLRAAVSALTQEQRTLEAQIAAQREQFVALRNRPSPEQAELQEAEAAARQARDEHAANPSAEAQARLNNAEFKLTLAERKWAKSNSEATALSEQIAALETRLAERQRAEQATRKRLETAERSAQQRLAAERAERERQEQELERTRREAEAAQAEIERLKALLAEQEKASQARSEEVEEAAPAIEAAKDQRPAVQESKVVAANTAAAVSPASSSAADDSSVKLTTQAAVLAELRRLQGAVAATDSRERLVNDILYAKRLESGREVAKIRVALRALGNDQYRGRERLPAGDYRLVAGFDEWPVTLSDSEALGEQVFLLDRSADASRLVLYSERLESSN